MSPHAILGEPWGHESRRSERCRRARGRNKEPGRNTCEGSFGSSCAAGLLHVTRSTPPPKVIDTLTLVARTVKNDGICRIPTAQKNGRTNLDIKCWDEAVVRANDHLRHEALNKGKTTHVGRVSRLSHEKYRELEPHFRMYQGRPIIVGKSISNGSRTMPRWQPARASRVSRQMRQSPARKRNPKATMCGQNCRTTVGCSSWKGIRRQVAELRLALYGHPLARVFWEQRCRKCLLELRRGTEVATVHRAQGIELGAYHPNRWSQDDRFCFVIARRLGLDPNDHRAR